MKKLFLNTVLLLAIISASALSIYRQDNNPQDSIALVENRKTDYVIVIPKDCSENIRYAANLFQKDIEKVSGCTIPIADKHERTENERIKEIRIGFPAHSQFIIHNSQLGYYVRENTLFIFGQCSLPWEENDAYTIYAVIDFLEKHIGIRKFAPDCEYYPQKETISLAKKDLNDSYSPENNFRHIQSSFTEENRNFKLWLKQNHYDDMFLKGYFVHTFDKLVPRNQYFEAHPEYYAQINGQRVIDQICLSHDSVFEIASRAVEKLIKYNSDHKIISISQNDNFSYCSCNQCKAINDYEESPAGMVISFANKIAERFPQQMFSTLAYQYSRKAPKHIKPAGNLQIMLCTIEEDRNKTIEQAGKASKSSFAADLEAWSKLTNHIFLWDYECNFHHSISPFPLLHTLKPNIEFFMRNHAHQHFQQAFAETGHEFAELKTYLISKLLWNINMDVDNIINEFLAAYYGAAAPYIRKYIDTLHYFAQQSGDFLDIYAPPTQYMNSFLSEDKMDIYADLLLFAGENLLYPDGNLPDYHDSKTDKYANRLAVQFLSLMYAVMEIGKVDMFGNRGWYHKNNDEKFVLKSDMQQLLEAFYNICTSNHVRLLNEITLTPKEYYETTLRFIDISVEDNLAFHKKITAHPMPSNKYGGGTIDLLTNGVHGASDHKIHWLGWWGEDCELTLDLDTLINDKTIKLSSLYSPKSWILHPAKIECYISKNNKDFDKAGEFDNGYEQNNDQVIKEYVFASKDRFRYIKFNITATKQLPAWHSHWGGKSWFFLDEIVVE